MDAPRRFRQWIIRLTAGAAVLWAVGALVIGPWLIRSAYAGESIGVLNRMISGQAETPLAEYLHAWRRLALIAAAGLAAGALALYAVAPALLRLPGTLRRAAEGLPARGIGGVLLSALWIGIVAGWAEAINGFVRHKVRHLPTGEVVSGELFWMAPLAAVAFLTAAGVVLYGLDRALRARGVLAGAAAPLFAALATFSLLRALSIGLASWAALLPALGIAVLTAQMLGDTPARGRRVLRLTLPGMLATLAVIASAVPLARRVAERAALRGLPPAAAGAPNVLLVIWDTARSMNLSLYGYRRPTSPVLEAFARRGAVFERAIATSPWSLPSHASMYTGRYPHEMTVSHQAPLDETHPTLAERLTSAGYVTGAFMANLFYGSADYGIGRGFAWYDARPPASASTIVHTWWLSRTLALRARELTGNHQSMLRRRASHVRGAFQRWEGRRGTRPFFAVLNFFDAHQPYRPPEPFNMAFSRTQPRYWFDDANRRYAPATLRQLEDAYDGALRYVDHELGQLLEWLRAEGLLDETLIVITADHGEEFGEHGSDLIGHSKSLNPQLIHVPLVIVHPNRVPAGIRLTETVSIRDIPATIVDALGLRPDLPVEGTSLLRYVDGTVTPAEIAAPRLAIAERHRWAGIWPGWPASKGHLFSLVQGPLQYILDAEGNEMIYDLSRDPAGAHDLSRAEEMRPSLDRFRILLDSMVPPVEGVRPARVVR
jgi:arylsulfatase A-like enzyme